MPLNVQVKVDPPHSVFVYDRKKLKAVMRAAGGEVAAVTRRLLRSAIGSGRVYRGSGSAKYRPYKAGHYRASAPGDGPALVTGTLLKSITSKPSKSGQSVSISSIFYGRILEHGAQGGGKGKASRNRRGAAATPRVLKPRPFLSTALDSRASSVADRIRQSIVDDIKFRRAK